MVEMAILNALPAQIALLDACGTIVTINEAWRSFAQANVLARADFCVGQNYLEVCEQATGDCSEEAREVPQGIRSVLQGRASVFTVEYPCHSPEEKRWFRLMATPISAQQQSGAVVMHIDITDRRLAEESLRNRERLLDIAGRFGRLGAWEYEVGTDELRWSELTCAIHGLPSDYQPTVNEALSFYLPEYRQMAARAVQACLEVGEPFDFVAELKTKTDRKIWVRAIGEAVCNDENEIVGLQGAFQDITEQKLLEEDLAASELRFRQLAEALPMIIWSAGPDGQIDYSNRQFSDYTGVPQSEDPATRWQGTLHPDDLERCFELWTACVQSGERFDIVYRIRRGSDDTFRWFRVQAQPVLDQQGTVVKWYGTALDIDDLVTLEKDARSLADRLTSTLESLTDGFITYDTQWRFTYVNAAAERLLRRPRHELLGKVLWEQYPEILGTTFEFEYRRARAENIHVVLEEYYPPLECWIEIRAYPSSEGLAVYLRDVTDRQLAGMALRESEERFQLLARATNDAIKDWDIRSGLLWWGEGLETLFGHQRSAVEPNVESWLTRIHPDERSAVVNSLYGALESPVESWEAEYRFKCYDGGYAYVMDRAYILRNNEGEAIRLVGGMTDLSERRELERQFLRAQRLESIGTLAGGIAHDLNNVLGPIILSLDLLKIQYPDREAQELLDMVSSSAQRGAEMVRQVLSFARGVEGRKLEVEISRLISEIQKITSETFPRNIEICTETPLDLWPVSGDSTQIHQVLLNLCVNARDAMPEGGRLTITAENVHLDEQYATLVPEATAGSYVALQVEDSGQGIAPELLDRIYEPFFTTKVLGQGSGLGLSTSLGIVKSHGGFIRVYSELGKGTKFKVYLPAQSAESSLSATEGETAFPRGKGQLILVVDDEANVRQITKQTLEEFGYRAILAGDGAEALLAFREHRTELSAVLTDLMMPVMDGPTTIRVLRKLDQEIPILAASGLSDSSHEAEAARLGVNQFLAKPFTAETLLRALDEVTRPSQFPPSEARPHSG